MNHPDPNTIYPIEGLTELCFLKNIIDHPQVLVGDYTYYHDPVDVYNFQKNVLYLYDEQFGVEAKQDRLIIGKFCQIATGARFIMNAANHVMNAASTYPFKVFGKSWSTAEMNPVCKGDTVIGNDVWIGNGATFMQGITVGDGAIIATSSVVTKDVAPYTIVGGNPAREIRKRFDQDTTDLLLQLQWWDWPIEKITAHLDALSTGDLNLIKQLGKRS
jgi:virginiamycin A acetyltransferase